jgi:CRP-like cAMP-binding protein
MKYPLQNHPQRHTLRLQLGRNTLLADLDDTAVSELAGLLVVDEAQRGDYLLEQGGCGLRQFFVLAGLLKRIVTSPRGREVTLRFAGDGDFETCHDACSRRQAAVPYSVVAAARSCVASLPMNDWYNFLDRHPQARQAFDERIAALGQSLVEHAVGLLLLDAPARVDAFSRLHPNLIGRLVQKDLASHLNLSAETLCRLVSGRTDWRPAKAVG